MSSQNVTLKCDLEDRQSHMMLIQHILYRFSYNVYIALFARLSIGLINFETLDVLETAS